MAKMVKLTDEVGELLAKYAEEDCTSLAGEIKALLDIRAGKGVSDGISIRLDNMASYLDKKFSHLESLIEDSTIDRVARTPKFSKQDLDWNQFRYLAFELCEEGAPEWCSKTAYDAVHNSDSEFPVFIEDNVICSENYYGQKTPLLKISSRVQEALDKKETW